MGHKQGKKQFEQQVFPLELEEINRRRAKVGQPAVSVNQNPAASNNLVGLCLSGGGIRSATFSLGVIQALSKHRLLKSVDYLSTVSGGGYIGSCLSSVLNSPETKPEGENFPFRETLGRDETQAVSHLRNSSNYLAPTNIFDKLRIPALVLRGMISNFLLFFFWVIIAVLLTEVFYELMSQYFELAYSTLVSTIFGLFLLMVLGYPILYRLSRGKISWKNRDRGEFWFTLVWFLSLTLMFLTPIAILINQAVNTSYSEFNAHIKDFLNHPFDTADIWIWLAMLGILFLYTRVGSASKKLSGITGKLILYTAGLIGPVILAALYLMLVVLEVDSPKISNDYRHDLVNGQISDRLRVQLEHKDVQLPKEVSIVPSPELPGWNLEGEYRYRLSLEAFADNPGKYVHITRQIRSSVLLQALQEAAGGWMTPSIMDILRRHHIVLSPDAGIEITQAPLPKDIVLLIDNSLPYGKVRQEARSALRTSVDEILSRPIYSNTRVAVIVFDDRIRKASNFIHVGRDAKELTRIIKQVNFSSKKTNEASSLFVALNKLIQSSRPGTEKIIILASDGILDSGNPDLDKDMASWLSNWFVESASSRSIKIYGIVLSEIANYNLFETLTVGTGGALFPAYNRTLMSEAFANIQKRSPAFKIPSQWSITDGETQHILVSRDNGVIANTYLPLTKQVETELSKVLDKPIDLEHLIELQQILISSGIIFNKEPSIVRVKHNNSDQTWQIREEFELGIENKENTLAIQWKQSWLRLWDETIDPEFIALFFMLLLYRILVEVNGTSIHSFYRDRLSRAFIFGFNKNREFQFNDDLKLHELNKDQTTAPYHLINVALNLHGSKDPELRGRKADFFIFSKFFTGSLRTGFTNTKNMEALDSHLNLGTAMAISGAAAAPNMGTTTIKQLVFLLTMLNIRLGYWLPNPRAVNENSTTKDFLLRFGVGARYLLRESLSRLNDTDEFVNISDGGHLENLGMYELLRRRCKFIISVDGEADPDMGFNGLVKLILYARIDMGIVIDIDLDPVRKNQRGISQKNWAIGTIRYGENEIGHLLYIKSSLSADENEYIREYKSRNPAFPHESTIDQFFDETQFEAYRALGLHIGNKVFSDNKELQVFSALRS